MESLLEDVLIPIVMFISIFGTIFGISVIYLKTRNSERLSLIEHGKDPQAYDRLKGSTAMMWALLAIGLGVGLLIGYAVERLIGIPGIIAYFAMMLLFGGAALFLNYRLQTGRKVSGG